MEGTRWTETRTELTLSSEAPPGLTAAQLHSYVLQVRLEEINRALRGTGGGEGVAVGPEAQARLEDERARLIEEALTRNPEFMAPVEYAAHIRDNRGPHGGTPAGAVALTDAGGALTPAAQALLSEGGIKRFGARWAEKIAIPQRDFPAVNFVGLLIGPRGNTLKKMEAESGARISIRGRGSLKEGRADPAALAAADDDLHVFLSADTCERVARAARLVRAVIDTALSTPDAANELKRVQLRELAALNGTLRDDDPDDALVCASCGRPGHRRFECLERAPPGAPRSTPVCTLCSAPGHVASDCLLRHDPLVLQQSRERAARIDLDYAAFMAQLSGAPAPGPAPAPGTASAPGPASAPHHPHPHHPLGHPPSSLPPPPPPPY